MVRIIALLFVAALGTACQTPGPEGISLEPFSSSAGLRGAVRRGEASIAFESRLTPEGLRSSIRSGSGEALFEYAEFPGETVPLTTPDGTALQLAREPELRILGASHVTSPSRKADLAAIAASPEGALIRELALQLHERAPGAALVAERRGLQLALQAMWRSFPGGSGAGAPALNDDYELTSAGFFVLSQPADLVLEINHLPQPQSGLRSRAGRPHAHDDDRVDGCFGRCGSGCTGGVAGIVDPWPSEWVDTTGPAFPAHQEVHCEDGSDVIYTFYATPHTHSVTGWWTSGCQLHDNCCKGGTLVCWTVCDVLIPEVAAFSGIGEHRTWSYSDYDWGITSYNAGYSGCGCPGSEYQDTFSCVE